MSDSNLILFPIHKTRKPKTELAKKQTTEQAQKIKGTIFIDQLVEEFSLDLIHVLQENAIKMKSKDFVKDLSVVIESIKSLLKRDFGQKHPMQGITDALAEIVTLPDGKKATDMNYNRVFVKKTPDKPLTLK